MDDSSDLRADRVAAFRALHVPGRPFALPNPWDVGSARVLEAAGACALATTSSGCALTLGRRDYALARDEALGHCRALCLAVSIPVSADLEKEARSQTRRSRMRMRCVSFAALCVEGGLRVAGHGICLQCGGHARRGSI